MRLALLQLHLELNLPQLLVKTREASGTAAADIGDGSQVTNLGHQISPFSLNVTTASGIEAGANTAFGKTPAMGNLQ